jgi:hypothetical protein
MKNGAVFDRETHWKYFTEFCKYETLSGGPDPQIKLIGEMNANVSIMEKLWAGGCYICVYNVPFAEVLWLNWSHLDVLNNQDDLLPWIERYWDSIKTRTERKCVRIKANMATFLIEYAKYINSDGFQKLLADKSDPDALYDKIFQDCQKNVKFLGRYVALKLVEYLRLYCGLYVHTTDIRPKGAWSPRKTLSVLWPDDKEMLLEGDDPLNLRVVNEASKNTIHLLKDNGVDIDLFQLQVMLCEYRESYEGMRQYPGRSHDSELGYWLKAVDCWGLSYESNSTMMDAREKLFPHQHLGEIQGWNRTRKDCGLVLAKHNYTWSDILYDYTQSKEGLENPACR